MFRSLKAAFGGGSHDSGGSGGGGGRGSPKHSHGHYELHDDGIVGLVDDPCALAYDRAQDLLAVGSRDGHIQIFGQEGVSAVWSSPEGADELVQLLFVPNTGRLVALHKPACLRLWSFASDTPKLLQTLEMSRVCVGFMSMPEESAWIIVGTTQGDIHFVHGDTFSRSTYSIMWNKVVKDGMRPGAVILAEENPLDAGELLLVYDGGHAVVWDVENKDIKTTFNLKAARSKPTSAAWGVDGKYMLIGHENGNITRWSMSKPSQFEFYGQEAEGLGEPVSMLRHIATKQGNVVVHTGGITPLDSCGNVLSIVVGDNSHNTVQVNGSVIDAQCIATADGHGAAVVLSEEGLACVNLADGSFMHGPRLLRMQFPPVCCVKSYNLGGGRALFAALQKLQSNGSHARRKPWPLSGGQVLLGEKKKDSVVFTGHDDGSVCVWDTSSQHPEEYVLVYTLPYPHVAGTGDKRPTVHHIEFKEALQRLVVAYGNGAVHVYQLCDKDQQVDVQVLAVHLHVPTRPKANEEVEQTASSQQDQETNAQQPERQQQLSNAQAQQAPQQSEQKQQAVSTEAGKEQARPEQSFDAKLAVLVQRGFVESAAVEALRAAKGNINEACMQLYDAQLQGKPVRRDKSSGSATPSTTSMGEPAERKPSLALDADVGETSTDEPAAPPNASQEAQDAAVPQAPEPAEPTPAASNAPMTEDASYSVTMHAAPGFQVVACLLSQLKTPEGFSDVVDHVSCMEIAGETVAWGNAFGCCVAAVPQGAAQVTTLGLSLSLVDTFKSQNVDGFQLDDVGKLDLAESKARVVSVAFSLVRPLRMEESVPARPWVLAGTSDGQVFFFSIFRMRANQFTIGFLPLAKLNSAVYGIHLLGSKPSLKDTVFDSRYIAPAPKVAEPAQPQQVDATPSEVQAMPSNVSAASSLSEQQQEEMGLLDVTTDATMTSDDDHEASAAVFKKFKARLGACTTTEELKLLAERIKSAIGAHLITAEQIAALRDLYRLHYAELSPAPSGQTTPKTESAPAPVAEPASATPADPPATPSEPSLPLQDAPPCHVLIVSVASVLKFDSKHVSKPLSSEFKHCRLQKSWLCTIGGTDFRLALLTDKGTLLVVCVQDLDKRNELFLRLPSGFRALRSVSVAGSGSVFCTTKSHGLCVRTLHAKPSPSEAAAVAESQQAAAEVAHGVGEDETAAARPSKLFNEKRNGLKKQRPGFMSKVFGSGPMEPSQREQLLGKTVDSRDSSHFTKRTTHEGGTVDPNNPMEKMRLKAKERGEKMAAVEAQSEQMAQEAQQFSNAASQLAEMYKNKKWYEL